MKKVELSPGIHSSILGFGCAPILGAVGGREAEGAMAAALDAGINHFDLARSYGYGQAEPFVGRFLRGRRDEVVLASKFGITATWKAKLLGPLKPLARAVKARRKGSLPQSAQPSPPPVAKRKDPFHHRIELTPGNMRKSLEKSLRALKTGHLDLFLVHEPPEKIGNIDDLAATAEVLKDEGKIRSWGLAFDWSNRAALRPDFHRFDLLQFDCSPIGGQLETVRDEWGSDKNFLLEPSRNQPIEDAQKVLPQLWTTFPASVVLCSMFNPRHVRENAAAAAAFGS